MQNPQLCKKMQIMENLTLTKAIDMARQSEQVRRQQADLKPHSEIILTSKIEQLVISDDFCGTDVNTPLGGSDPVRASPVITFQSPLLTSVAATSTHDFTVAFLGTSTGHLLK
uniref:Sema domain-containing protein n=1 Tax=Strigamia maritima TaxID=126957 RepID=T1IWD9_STRMM